jgi:type I restriction enzyme S subunit
LSLNAIVPPLVVQRKFSDFVASLKKTAEKQRQSTDEITELFQSLMHKAFRGELRIETDDKETMRDQSSLGNCMG